MKTRIIKLYISGGLLILVHLFIYYWIGFDLFDFLLHETAYSLPERLIPLTISFIPLVFGVLRIRKGWRLQKGIEIDGNYLIDSLPGE